LFCQHINLSRDALEGRPIHMERALSSRLNHTPLPTEPFPELAGPTQGPVVLTFRLTPIGNRLADTTGQTAVLMFVKDRRRALTARTTQRRVPPTKRPVTPNDLDHFAITFCPGHKQLVIPNEDFAPTLQLRPGQAKRTTGKKHPLPAQQPDIQVRKMKL
jgi:hypothetical protein